LIDVFHYTKSIESNFNGDSGLFGSEFEDKMNIIAFGLKNVAEIVLDGLKQYFTLPLPNEIMEYFYPFEEFEHNILLQQSEKIKAPVLALFCSLINEIGIDKKEETESALKYCKRICEKFGFPFTDRVRQNYYGNKTKETRKVFIEKVFPLLDAETKSKVQKFLDTKYPPTQNLYA
jgi:ribosomal protein S21